MDKNRLTGLRTVGFNLLAEGQTSRGDCVNELCNEVERLQDVLERIASGEAYPAGIARAALGFAHSASGATDGNR